MLELDDQFLSPTPTFFFFPEALLQPVVSGCYCQSLIYPQDSVDIVLKLAAFCYVYVFVYNVPSFL